MVVYDSCFKYLQSRTTLLERVAAIDAIIAAMEVAALAAATNEGVSQYSLNDGQTIISTTSRSVSDITKSIKEMISLKNYYINQPNMNGRVRRLVDGKNMIGNGRNW